MLGARSEGCKRSHQQVCLVEQILAELRVMLIHMRRRISRQAKREVLAMRAEQILEEVVNARSGDRELNAGYGLRFS